jgi:uncharacterized membrane protein
MNVPKSAATPPGRKLLKKLSLQTKSIVLTVVGLLLTLFGVSVLVNANTLRLTETDTNKWALLGFYSFAILVAGLLTLGQAFRFRLLIDFRRETRKELNRIKKRIDSKHMKNRQTASKRHGKTKNPTK